MSDRLLDNLLITMLGGVLVVMITLPLTGTVPVFVESESFGIPINTALWYLLVSFAVGLTLLFIRYLRVISGAAGEAHSFERKRFLEFRRHLEAGGTARAIYADQLGRVLDAVDRFFGDAGRPASPQWRRLFRLQGEVPLWSVLAYDRCLLLALIYPMGVAFLIWVVIGEAGSLGQALRLKVGIDPMQRVALLVGVGCFAFSLVRAMRAKSMKQLLNRWAAFFVVAVVVNVTVLEGTSLEDTSDVAISMAGVIAFALATAGAFATPGALITAGGVALTSGGVIGGYGATVTQAITMGLALAAAFASVRAIRKGHGSIFYVLLTAALLGCCLLVPFLADLGEVPTQRSGLLLFLGLLTLLNAPFDWISLGLTRGFLRKGLELTGGWPWLLALLDAALATVLIVALSATMVIGVQAFDAVVVHSASVSPLPIVPLLDGLAEPTAPEYWWVYILLLSTLFPSLVNLVVGGCSLVRGLPSVMPWLVSRLPQERPKGERAADQRYLVAGVLTAQWGFGILFAIAAQALLIYGILGWLMPTFGVGLLESMQWLAAQDVPQRVFALLSAW